MGQTSIPEKFTTSTMVDYVATSNGISKKEAKNILDSFFDLVQKGVMSGQRVPLGILGKLYMHTKAATPERNGVNPATGEPMVIKAKPASKVPKFRFNKAFKDSVKDC